MIRARFDAGRLSSTEVTLDCLPEKRVYRDAAIDAGSHTVGASDAQVVIDRENTSTVLRNRACWAGLST
ncbi:MAG: hypothetical protein V3V85_01600 [Candidatus Thorarchaeota archaeon]